MQEIKKPQDDEKELKKLLESYLAVAKHKHGRTPTLEELQKMLSENEGQEKIHAKDAAIPVASQQAPENGVPNDLNKVAPDINDPKILRMLVYYGMGAAGQDGTKKPDSNKILFYEDPKEKRVYDTSVGAWTDNRPAVIDHLSSRPIEFSERDIVAAIAHGIVDDQDYDSLDKAGMITDTPRQLWSKMSLLRKQMGDLEKSSAPEGESFEEDEVEDTEDNQDLDYTAGVEPEGFAGETPAEPGDDVFSQIWQAALADPETGMEDAIRRIVHEELESMSRYSHDEEEPQYDEEEPESDLTDYGSVVE